MKKKLAALQKNRKATEKKILDTLREMAAENGFEKIKINTLAARSGVSKVLIYRYFGSIKGVIAAYLQQYDFWVNFPQIEVVQGNENITSFLKKIFQLQIAQMRNDEILKKLCRWELSTNNEMLEKIREQRETTGLRLIHLVQQLTQHPQKEIAAIATILVSAIRYLVMFQDFCPKFNDIQLNTEEGWAQINDGINLLIDLYINKNKQ